MFKTNTTAFFSNRRQNAYGVEMLTQEKKKVDEWLEDLRDQVPYLSHVALKVHKLPRAYKATISINSVSATFYAVKQHEALLEAVRSAYVEVQQQILVWREQRFAGLVRKSVS
tara:strand:- start:13627 stop:13965 length:339 start_codon:yes stop_codon:yes gene_type:complete